jgi:hypothetical protein
MQADGHLSSIADRSSLISGGADSAIKLWDLGELTTGSKHTFRPSGIVPR